MVQYIEAKKGMKKVALAVILKLAGIILYTIPTIFTLTENTTIATAMLFLLLFGCLLELFGFIFSIVGLHQAGKDSIVIKNGFKLSIIGIVTSILYTILSSITALTDTSVGSLIVIALEIFNHVVEIGIVICVCKGVSSMLLDRGEEKLSKSGSSTATLFSITFAISTTLVLICGVFEKDIFGDNMFASVIVILLFAVVYLILDIIACLRYFIFVERSKNKLAD